MSVLLDDESFEVIGSTVTFTCDNLPRRLRPIYRRAGYDDVWFVAMTRNRDESNELARLDPEEAKDLAEEGQAMLLERPLRARVGHILLQVNFEGDPDYLSPLDVPHRLRQAESDALRRAACTYSAKDSAMTLRWLWYARRASLDDPLPLVLLIAILEREGEPTAALRVLFEELEQFDRASREAAETRLRTAAALSPFVALRAPPSYLPSSHTPELANAARWARGGTARTR